jgi:hypothetical protein
MPFIYFRWESTEHIFRSIRCIIAKDLHAREKITGLVRQVILVVFLVKSFIVGLGTLAWARQRTRKCIYKFHQNAILLLTHSRMKP